MGKVQAFLTIKEISGKEEKEQGREEGVLARSTIGSGASRGRMRSILVAGSRTNLPGLEGRSFSPLNHSRRCAMRSSETAFVSELQRQEGPLQTDDTSGLYSNIKEQERREGLVTSALVSCCTSHSHCDSRKDGAVPFKKYHYAIRIETYRTVWGESLDKMMNSGAMETGGEIEKDIANTIISADKVIIPFGSNRSNQKLLGHAKRRISRRKPESYHVLRNFEVVAEAAKALSTVSLALDVMEHA
ncbi:hypothetical protein RRG08_008331 [Elysia crispata]|uniref:Uncharacterized protein n=1 Tax=Elysia crispata TaxID=231223 RepID=A0AAE1DTL4_9GAST|nr:hypothetical protein RRG08_008331 [Elysia crispata]